ncbi:hypothetical protein C4900_15610 [Acidiferrobacter thiooxydans]|uniref:Cytochrome oxidase subunit II copper A binding domain-containing protein n=1 Tax=Acidiferrobacter thiooxydans TaxID=163359 RepID=A0A368HDQ6_9GAMM|nr:hypothetical protein C4900_15610 [Acidiferrobacter thiooxydans]
MIPRGTPVVFHMTSATVVNDFFIPNLAGMIDVMPGMRTKQVLVADKIVNTGDIPRTSAAPASRGWGSRRTW